LSNREIFSLYLGAGKKGTAVGGARKYAYHLRSVSKNKVASCPECSGMFKDLRLKTAYSVSNVNHVCTKVVMTAK
jgi:hypothetical protein